MGLGEGKLLTGIGYDVIVVANLVKFGPGGFLLIRQTISGVAVGWRGTFKVLE